MWDSPFAERGISLADLFPEAQICGADDIVVESCTSDSRACRDGELFAALYGTQHDGHDFIDQAIANGAGGILAERLVPAGAAPVCIVPDSRNAYGRLCHALAGDPSRRVHVVGVTGTNGKTTTSCLITSVLATAGLRTGIMGTLGHCDGDSAAENSLTTPSAPALASWLARCLSNHCQHAVLEISSHALCQSRVAGVELDAVCITNLRHDHLDYHGSVANYHRAKAKIFDYLRPGRIAVINADDPFSADLVKHHDGPVLTAGLQEGADITATVIERIRGEQTFLLTAGDDIMPVRTRIVGDHHVQNCLLAAAMGLAYEIDLPTIVRGLESVDEIPGRMEQLDCGQPFGVYVDYAHTADALATTLQALREVTPGRVLCVFGAGGDRDTTKRSGMGRAVAEHADHGYITCDNPRRENPLKIIREIMRGCNRSGCMTIEPNRQSAIELALSQAREGDTVLIAGKGHECYQIFGDEKFPFDDRVIARHWLYNAALQSDGPNLWRAA